MKNKLSIFSWCLFDWANSPFAAIVITFIFSTYFTQHIAINQNVGTAQWGNAMALASLIIAFLGPLTGAIADNTGRRKPWLATCSLIMIIPTALLWYALPSHHYAFFTLSCVVIATVGVELGMVFYNSMLPDIAPESHTGRVSGWGWGLGYIGGLICLCIALYGFISPQHSLFHLDRSQFEHIRITGPLTSLWLVIFAIPLFMFTQDKKGTRISTVTAIKRGLKELRTTIKKLPHIPYLIRYLIARMIYTDGINTIFFFGGIYAAGTFHFTVMQILELGIVLNITAGIGAICFAWIDDWYGSKLTILIALSALLISLSLILVIQSPLYFWIVTAISGLFYGPAQAASRTLMSRIAPKELMTEMFGIYALSGKASAFLGPWLVGTLTLVFNSQRAGMSIILIFLIVGGALLVGVKEPKYIKT